MFLYRILSPPPPQNQYEMKGSYNIVSYHKKKMSVIKKKSISGEINLLSTHPIHGSSNLPFFFCGWGKEVDRCACLSFLLRLPVIYLIVSVYLSRLFTIFPLPLLQVSILLLTSSASLPFPLPPFLSTPRFDNKTRRDPPYTILHYTTATIETIVPLITLSYFPTRFLRPKLTYIRNN